MKKGFWIIIAWGLAASCSQNQPSGGAAKNSDALRSPAALEKGSETHSDSHRDTDAPRQTHGQVRDPASEAARFESTRAQEASHPFQPASTPSSSSSATQVGVLSSYFADIEVPDAFLSELSSIEKPTQSTAKLCSPAGGAACSQVSRSRVKGLMVTSLLPPIEQAPVACQHVARTTDRAFLFHLDHLSMRQELQGDLASRSLDLFLQTIDPEKKYFLSEDLRSLEARYADSLGELLARGDCQVVHDVQHLMARRVRDSVQWYREILQNKQRLFSAAYGQESQLIPRAFASDAAALKERLHMSAAWRLHSLRIAAPHMDEAQIIEILRGHAQRQLEYFEASQEHIHLAFLKALLHSLDPHSAYHPTADQAWDHRLQALHFQQGEVRFIAAPHEGYVQVVREVSSRPYAGHRAPLKDGDRVYAIRPQGSSSWRWLAGFHRPARYVKSIPEGLELFVVRPSSSQSPYRDLTFFTSASLKEVEEDPLTNIEQKAQGRLFTLEDHHGGQERVGVLRIPLFYREGKAVHHRKVSDDVSAALNDMVESDAAVLLIDLRGNGGGFMSEAFRVAYLLMSPRILGQTQSTQVEDRQLLESTQDISIRGSSDPLFDGPVVVLTDRFTASASEFLAQALQAHGRALVVGDAHTYGKGTMQNLLPLKSPGGELAGMIRITTGRFFSVDGHSVQLGGLEPHITIPSHSGLLFSDLAESGHEHAMSHKSLPPKFYQDLGWMSEQLQASLQRRSRQRVIGNLDFHALAAVLPRGFHDSSSFKGLEWFKSLARMNTSQRLRQWINQEHTSTYNYRGHAHSGDVMLSEAMSIAVDYARMLQ